MSISTPSLKQFIQRVPICLEAADLAMALDVFSAEQCDRLVVVNPQQYPLGVLHLHRLIPYLHAKNYPRCQEIPHSQSYPSSYTQSTPCNLHSFIEPITTLPDHFTLQEFWPYLQKLINTKNYQHWALIDASGQFLGLLDSWLLLNYINSYNDITFNQTINNISAKANLTSENKAQPENNSSLQLLIAVLEQLPLPICLQTQAGQIISQNPAWRKQLGESESLSHQPGNNPSSLPVKQQSDVGASEADHQNYSRVDSTKKIVYTDLGYDPIWPHKSFGHPSRVTLSEPITTKSEDLVKEKLAQGEASFNAYSKNRQERVWQFVKISLVNLHLTLNSEEWADSEPKLQDSQGKLASFLPTSASIDSELILVLAQDLTEQQQVAEELAAKNADLIQLNRLKDEFLACISHELKTPLTSVIGLSSLLKDQLLGQLNERQLRYAQLIHHSGRQLMIVVNDILDLARMETGQMELTPDLVEIKSVCDRAFLQACQRPSQNSDETEIDRSEIPFRLEIEPGLETMVADELRLRQMLFHLLSNAIKFTPLGGEFGLKVNSWDDWIAFTVWDTGIGIPPEKQHLIFQKFQQLENPLTRKFDGTGLGLVLTQRLAHLHGGDISFTSKPGQGSQFTLLLPPIPPQKSLDEDLPITVFQSQYNRLVLIVEATPQYIEELKVNLLDLGYQAIIARSGTDALEKARRLQPAFILLNPLLPLLSGWDVLTLLKTDLQTKHIPIVITATQAEKDLAQQNKASGFLSIPVQKEALQHILSSLKKPPRNSAEKLTILHLNSELTTGEFEPTKEVSTLETAEERQNYQVIEVDDLEQAELLAQIWHPDVLLLDNPHLEDPLSYVTQLSQYSSLATLPLVTLDIEITQAANQVSGLSVFPYLAATEQGNAAALWQVIEVAAGISSKHNILIVDIGCLSDLPALTTETQSSSLDLSLATTGNLESSRFNNSSKGNFSGTETNDLSNNLKCKIQNQKQKLAWIPALNDYLEAAGFNTYIPNLWKEVFQNLQDKSINLILLYITEIPSRIGVIEALKSLSELPNLPPVLVVDSRLTRLENNADSNYYSTNLEKFIKAVATEIMRGPPESMAGLLTRINQILYQNKN